MLCALHDFIELNAIYGQGQLYYYVKFEDVVSHDCFAFLVRSCAMI